MTDGVSEPAQYDQLLAKMFADPEQLGANQSSEHTGHRGVARRRRQAAARQLAAKQPQADECADRHHHAERCDVKISEADQRWVHECRNYR